MPWLVYWAFSVIVCFLAICWTCWSRSNNSLRRDARAKRMPLVVLDENLHCLDGKSDFVSSELSIQTREVRDSSHENDVCGKTTERLRTNGSATRRDQQLHRLEIIGQNRGKCSKSSLHCLEELPQQALPEDKSTTEKEVNKQGQSGGHLTGRYLTDKLNYRVETDSIAAIYQRLRNVWSSMLVLLANLLSVEPQNLTHSISGSENCSLASASNTA